MISVPNRQLLLSGSNRALSLALLLILAISCNSSKRGVKSNTQVVPANKPPRQEVVESASAGNKNTTKVDTIVWTKVEKASPIGTVPTSSSSSSTSIEKGGKQSNVKNYFKVAFFIPLNSSRYNEGSSNDVSYLEYYCGAKIAAEELLTTGVNIDIDVFDSDHTKSLPSATAYDVIITSNDKDQVASLIELGKKEETLIISPWYSNSKATEKNPNYLQLNPNLREHFNKIVEHATSRFKSDEIVLVGLDKKLDRSWFKYFQEVGQGITKKERPFEEYFVTEDSLALGTWVFGDLIAANKKAFIVPNYSFKDESHVYSVLRRLSAERGSFNIHVYGMPLMLDSDKIDFDFYNNLNIKVAISEFVDEDDYNVKAFQSRYYTLYADLPSNNAYEGHDMLLFLGEALSEYGTTFPSKIQQKPRKDYLQTSFDIRGVRADGGVVETSEDIDFYENKYLSIIEFKNGKFRKSK